MSDNDYTYLNFAKRQQKKEYNLASVANSLILNQNSNQNNNNNYGSSISQSYSITNMNPGSLIGQNTQGYDKSSLQNIQFQNQFQKQVLLNANQLQRQNKIMYSDPDPSRQFITKPLTQKQEQQIKEKTRKEKDQEFEDELDRIQRMKQYNNKEIWDKDNEQSILKRKHQYDPNKVRMNFADIASTNYLPNKDVPGNYETIFSHKPLMNDKQTKNFTSDKLSKIIEDNYYRILGNSEVNFRIDQVIYLPLNFQKIEFQMGLLVRTNEDRQSVYRMKYKQIYQCHTENIKYQVANIRYKDTLQIIRNPDMFLYFEINAIIEGQKEPKKYAWSLNPIFDARGEIVYGKFIVPLYTFKTGITYNVHMTTKQQYKPQMLMWVSKGDNQQFQKDFNIPRKLFYMSQLHDLIRKQQSSISSVDIGKILSYSEQLKKKLEDSKNKGIGVQSEDINALRNQILQKLDDKINQIKNMDQFEGKTKKGLDKLDKLRYFKKVIQQSRHHEFDDRAPTYTWQYPVAEYWQIPFILPKKGFRFEKAFTDHFDLKGGRIGKTLEQIKEEEELKEKMLKYKPEEEDPNYFDQYEKMEEEKKKKRKERIEKRKKRREEKRLRRDAGELVSSDSDTDDDDLSDSEDHFVAKQIEIEEFNPQEDDFDHQSMKNLDKLLKKKKDGVDSDEWSSSESSEEEAFDDNGNPLLFKNKKDDDDQSDEEQSMNQTGTNMDKSQSSKGRKTVEKSVNNVFQNHSRNKVKRLTKDGKRKTSMGSRGSKQSGSMYSGGREDDKDSVLSGQTDKTGYLHPDQVQKAYAKEQFKRQGDKAYDDYRNYDVESDLDSWASVNDWASLKRDYHGMQREFHGPFTPSIFDRTIDSFNRTEDLFYNPPLVPNYNREELNDLWHFLFGDLTEKYKKDKIDEFRGIIEGERKRMQDYPQILPNLKIVIHNFKNFPKDKIKIRLAIVKDDQTLGLGNKDIILHQEIYGVQSKKKSNVLILNFVTIFSVDLQLLKHYFTALELMKMQLVFTFYDKFGCKAWFFHPLYVQDESQIDKGILNKKNIDGREFIKPAYGKFNVNMFDIPMQKPPFNTSTRFSNHVMEYSIMHRDSKESDLEYYDLEKDVPEDTGNRLFLTILEINGIKNNKDPLTYEMEILSFQNDDILEDRNGDECKIEDQSLEPIGIKEKINYFQQQVFFNVAESDLIEHRAKLKYKFFNSKGELVGQKVFDFLQVNDQVKEGEFTEFFFNDKNKKQKTTLKFFIEMAQFKDIIDGFDQFEGIQITMKKVGNYRDTFDMAYSINFMKDSMLLADDNGDPIQFKSQIFYQCDEKRQIKFGNQQLQIPINPEKMRLQYYNHLHKLYIQFKFAIRLDDNNNQEMFAWYAHPLFDAVEKLFVTGFFDVEMYLLPVIEDDFYDTRFERIPVRFIFRIDTCRINPENLKRLQESKESIYSTIIQRAPTEQEKEQFSVRIHTVKNVPKIYTINFGILDPSYIKDDVGQVCNLDVEPENYDDLIHLLHFNTVTDFNIALKPFRDKHLQNLHNVHYFMVLKDIEDDSVGYWVYIKMFDHKLKFITGEFREKMYVGPLVRPQDLDKQFNQLILSDVEIAYSIQKTSFIENDDEYMSETNTQTYSHTSQSETQSQLSQSQSQKSQSQSQQSQTQTSQFSGSQQSGQNLLNKPSNKTSLQDGDIRKDFDIKGFAQGIKTNKQSNNNLKQ